MLLLLLLLLLLSTVLCCVVEHSTMHPNSQRHSTPMPQSIAVMLLAAPEYCGLVQGTSRMLGSEAATGCCAPGVL